MCVTINMAAYEMEPYGLDQVTHLYCKVLSTLTTPFGVTKKHVSTFNTIANLLQFLVQNIFVWLNFIQVSCIRNFYNDESFLIYGISHLNNPITSLVRHKSFAKISRLWRFKYTNIYSYIHTIRTVIHMHTVTQTSTHQQWTIEVDCILNVLLILMFIL